MGIIEEQVRKRARKQDIRKAILTTIKVAGVLALAMAAPNAARLLAHVPGMRAKYESRAMQSLCRLEQRRLVTIRGTGRSRTVQLAPSGEALLARLSMGGSYINYGKKWDRRWRIVIFDIPEKRKALRNRLRMLLATIGFEKLQDSVWVFPYDCEDLLTLLKTDFRIGKEVLYIVAEEIEGDYRLRKLFGLE